MNLLFIRLSAIGDVIQAAAALKLYRNSHPRIRITWAVDQALLPLVTAFDVADGIIPIDSDGLFKGSLVSRLSNLWKSMRQIAVQGNFDVVCTAHPDWRFGLLAGLVGSKKRISPKSLSRSGDFIPDRHRTFEYYRLLTGQDSGLLPIDEALVTLGASLLNSQPQVPLKSFGLPKNYIVLIPGGARNALRDNPQRRWPIKSYVHLAESLLNHGYSIVLLGGPGDAWVSEYFDRLQVIDLVGNTTLLDMVFLLDQARCVVAHDSGPIHLTSITTAPLVGIFGPTPANAVLSFSRPRTVILEPQNQVSCSPCYDGREYAPCVSHVCMESTTVERVLFAINGLVSSG